MDAGGFNLSALDELAFNNAAAVPSATSRMRRSGAGMQWRGEDARTNSVVAGLTIAATTSGTPAANIGTRILVQGESSDETPSDFVGLDAIATDISAAGEFTALGIGLRVNGAALTEVYRLRATGAFLLTIQHALTAARTLTIPDATTTMVGTDTTQTLSGKSLTAPVLSTGSTVTLGTGTGAATLVGVASVNTTGVATPGTTEADLMTYSLPANSLSADGKGVRITAFFTTTANANNKTARLYFGGTVIATPGAIALNNGTIRLTADVFRTGAATQDGFAVGQSNTAVLSGNFTSPAETLSGAVTIKTTGETPTASGDLTCQFMLVEMLN